MACDSGGSSGADGGELGSDDAAVVALDASIDGSARLPDGALSALSDAADVPLDALATYDGQAGQHEPDASVDADLADATDAGAADPNAELGYACGFRGHGAPVGVVFVPGVDANAAWIVGDQVLTAGPGSFGEDWASFWTLWNAADRTQLAYALQTENILDVTETAFLVAHIASSTGQLDLILRSTIDGRVLTTVHENNDVANHFHAGIGRGAPYIWLANDEYVGTFDGSGAPGLRVPGDFRNGVVYGTADRLLVANGPAADSILQIPLSGTAPTSASGLVGTPITWFADGSHVVTSDSAGGASRVYTRDGVRSLNPTPLCTGNTADAYFGTGNTFVCTGAAVNAFDLSQGQTVVATQPVPLTGPPTKTSEGFLISNNRLVVTPGGVSVKPVMISSTAAPALVRVLAATDSASVALTWRENMQSSSTAWLSQRAGTSGELGCSGLTDLSVSPSGLIAIRTGASGTFVYDLGASHLVAQFQKPVTLDTAGARLLAGAALYELRPRVTRLAVLSDLVIGVSPNLTLYGRGYAAADPGQYNVALTNPLTGDVAHILMPQLLGAPEDRAYLVFSSSDRSVAVGQPRVVPNQPVVADLYHDGVLTGSTTSGPTVWLSDTKLIVSATTVINLEGSAVATLRCTEPYQVRSAKAQALSEDTAYLYGKYCDDRPDTTLPTLHLVDGTPPTGLSGTLGVYLPSASGAVSVANWSE